MLKLLYCTVQPKLACSYTQLKWFYQVEASGSRGSTITHNLIHSNWCFY